VGSSTQTTPDPAPPPSDEALESAWRAGSRVAFSDLFRRHYAGVVSYVRRFVGDTALAEDLAQQAFVNIYGRRTGSGRFKSLAYTVARNLALNELRRQGRRYVARSGLGEVEPRGSGPGPVRQLIEAEEQHGLAAAIASLPDELREAFTLKETRGLTYAEVGRAMGLHPDAARRRVAKALGLIRAHLGSGSLL
jgi:RNA polymerase sigma-70 factor (ECF subfamily)